GGDGLVGEEHRRLGGECPGEKRRARSPPESSVTGLCSQPDRPPAGAAAVARALAAVGLSGCEHRPVTELSGGERARALLARALATEAPVLLADEPVAALDPRHQLLVLEVLRERARAGAVVVAVMHDLALAARFADRIALLAEGRLAGDGPPEAVLTPERLAAHFGVSARVERRDGTLVVTPWRALAR
ncbi:MAG TPA: ABC transporter ATP-binding protein, partial [Beijerinckiaceae bacterium]|nr:ABC transporter ATP-binding protein [Beijerinckiaceae bacterium]